MKIGEILKEKGYIENNQLLKALHEQTKEMMFYNKPVLLGKVLIKLNYIDSEKLVKALNKQNGHN